MEWIYSLPNLVFIAIIAIIATFVTIITAQGPLLKEKSKGTLSFNERGWAVALLNVLVIVILILQEASREHKEDEMQSEQETRDWISWDKTDSVRQVADSLTTLLVALRDSTEFSYQPDPIFQIEEDGIWKDEEEGGIKVSFKSDNAPSTNFQLKKYYCFRYSDGYELYREANWIDSTVTLKSDGDITFLISNWTLEGLQEVIFYINGTYTTMDRRRKYFINDVYFCEKPFDWTGKCTEPYRTEYIQKFKVWVVK